MGLKVSILNSRQGIKPSLSDSWIHNTIDAITFIQKNNYTLVSSIGMPTWDIVTTLGSLYQIPMILYLPIRYNRSITKSIELAKFEFELNYNDVQYIPLLDKSKEFTVRRDRDTEIISSSDKIIPISIRQNGNLSKHLKSVRQNKIIDMFTCSYKKRFDKYAYIVTKEKVNPQISPLKDNYYYHWTKTTYGKRENERSIDYYRSILTSKIYPRTAFHNLQNIIFEQAIFASSKNIPSKTQVVAFTDCPPFQMYPLFRWRSQHLQMSFEPYGIAFEKEVIKKKLSKVKYFSDKSDLESSTPLWQTHSIGKKTDWSLEREYRNKSDFDFSEIDKNKIICITRFKKEADELSELTGIKTLSYTTE